jgi:hypothetical protein
MDKLNILPMIDKSDTYNIKKDVVCNVPFKMGIVGKSQLSGKTTLACNLIMRDEYYGKDFKGENIYIISPSLETPKIKNLIKYKKIPDENLYLDYDEEELEELYDMIEENFNDKVNNNKKPVHSLILFDDIGYSGKLRNKSNGIMDKMICNGRHFLLSSMILVQKYTQLSPCFRENLTGLISYACSYNQLEFIINEHNTTKEKKIFIKEFLDATNKKHSFFFINYSNDFKQRFMENFNKFIEFS